MAIVLGLDAILMRGPAGSTGSTEVKNVKDLTLNLESGDADVTTRATKGWRASVATLKEASLEFQILYDTEDEAYNAFADAYFNNTPMALFVTDGNGTGLDADFSITGFSIEQPLEEALSVKAAIAVLGGKYKAIIIWHLNVNKIMRYNEIQKAIPQATAKMLSQQLKELENDGIVRRKLYPVVPPKTEYSLTEQGKTLVPIVNSMSDWGHQYFDFLGLPDPCPED